MTTAQVDEMSVTVNDNSPILDYIHLDDQTQPTCEMTPGFKPFTKIQCNNDTLKKAQTRKMTTLFKRETNAESLMSTKLWLIPGDKYEYILKLTTTSDWCHALSKG